MDSDTQEKNVEDNQPTPGNGYDVALMDKVQKLTSALYRVTDLYSDKEPIKWTLRENAMFLYSNLMSFMSIKKSSQVFEDILESISKIVRILEIASMGFFVSNMNFEILKKEYLVLKDIMEGKRQDIVVDQNLLGLSIVGDIGGNNLPQISIGQTNGHTKSIGHQDEPPSDIVRKNNVKENDNTNNEEDNTNNILKTKENSIGHLAQPTPGVGYNGHAESGSSLSPDKNRKTKILAYLENNENKTIGDISSIFSGTMSVSGKTIQRDLADLIKAGRIKAEGEKRWRVYAIIR